jgi:DNA-binding response OmpR family regulator
MKGRILCIGKDPGLLRSRVAVLGHAGYDALDVLFEDADALLSLERFDLVILSAILTDEEKAHIRAITGSSTPILALKKLVFASELLSDVENYLRLSRLEATAT